MKTFQTPQKTLKNKSQRIPIKALTSHNIQNKFDVNAQRNAEVQEKEKEDDEIDKKETLKVD